MNSSKTLEHMDMSLLQKRVADLQASSQVKKTLKAYFCSVWLLDLC